MRNGRLAGANQGVEDFFRLAGFLGAPNSPTYFHRLASEATRNGRRLTFAR